MGVIGVIGTMVWDTIWRDGEAGSPVEEWGGISYALAAADAFGTADLKVRPIIKLGHDLAERGLGFLRELSILETDETISVVETPNPRVELRYTSAGRRSEWLRGGVSTWTWPEIAPRIEGCDAIYVNFITGSEIDLEVARQLRQAFSGPIYVDVHSLLLATGPRGERRRCTLDSGSDWLSCFDVVQVNEDELAALSARWGDPWAFAAAIVGCETRLLFVTLGPGGAAYVMTPDALPLKREPGRVAAAPGPVRTGRVSVAPLAGGDPTGCGDVWGITAFRALLSGRTVEEAIGLANAFARRNVAHRGATGLNRFLRGELERG